MTRIQTRTRSTAFALFAALLMAGGVAAQEIPKPLLSAEIRTAFEAEGSEGARARFSELFPDSADQVQMDMQGLYALAAERIAAGDMKTGEALMEMVVAVNQALMETAMPGISAAAAAERQEKEGARGE